MKNLSDVKILAVDVDSQDNEQDMKRAVGYIRVSTSDQAEFGVSLEFQVDSIKQHCLNNNFDLIEICKDEGVSGFNKSMYDRAGAAKLIDYITSDKIDYVIVTKNDRLGRDHVEKLLLRKLMKKHSVKVICLFQHGLGEDETPEQILMTGMFDLLDEFYSQNLSRDAKKFGQKKADLGEYTGGKVPFGYRVDNQTKKYIVFEPEAKIVRLIFNMYLQGNGIQKINKYLQENHQVTGKTWSHSTVREMLLNPNYTGDFVWNRNEGKRVKKKFKDKKDWVIKPDNHEVIIPKDIFQQVEKLRGERNRNSNKDGNKNPNINHSRTSAELLAGLIRCGCCGNHYGKHNVTSKRTGKTNLYYKCSGKIRHSSVYCKQRGLNLKKMDALIIDTLAPVLTKDMMLQILNDNWKKCIEELKQETERPENLSKQIQKCERNILKYRALIDEEDDFDLIREHNKKIKELTQEIKNLKKELEESDYNNFTLEFDTMYPLAGELEFDIRFFKTLDKPTLKEFLGTLIKQITVRDLNNRETEIEIQLQISSRTLKTVIDIQKVKPKLIAEGENMFFVEDNEGDMELVIKNQRNQFTNDFFLTNVMSFDCSAPPPPYIK
ncbi:recombinase family protein [Brevibacillus borstelensis]|uniref:recombinase family protein n=1 Tax=Brevibacillus borstelensis TaxID=45462 RepID=UPI00203F9F12|nr:recombinase family protein [Brevibacillus borstelensis]MCM3473573.1 recombinase family protein [Brevibacillus borstelensis]MED1855019.1 recombinase family protein [Brevibacillus borstelensis]